eukprot:SAG31_NODE_1870_length_7027_cov_6.614319_6_plen_135_part_00
MDDPEQHVFCAVALVARSSAPKEGLWLCKKNVQYYILVGGGGGGGCVGGGGGGGWVVGGGAVALGAEGGCGLRLGRLAGLRAARWALGGGVAVGLAWHAVRGMRARFWIRYSYLSTGFTTEWKTQVQSCTPAQG